MSTLVDRSSRGPAPGPGSRPPSIGPARSPVATGALAAVQAAMASLVVMLVPVVFAWATASYSEAPWGQALEVGFGAWLLAHHAGIVIPGGHVGLVPLGLTLVPLVTCWFAGVRLARSLDPHADAIRSGVGRARPVLPPPRALLALIISYAGLVTLACVLTTTPSIRPLVAQAFVGAALICGTAATAGAAAWVAGGVLPGVRLMVSWLRLPKPVSRCLRPVGLALVIHLGGALLLLVAAMVIGWDRVLMLHHALAPGVPGGLVLVIAQLAVVPNLVIWSGAFVAGPGFAVGTGTSVLPGHTVLGALPAVPVLGVLPTPSEGPGWAWAVLAFPVLAGAVAGWWILQAEPTGDLPVVVRAALRGTGLTALLAGVCWGVLSWLSGGPAGPGRLAQIGPSPWQVGLAVGIEVGLGALLAVGVGVALRWRALRWRDESPPAQLGG